MTEEKSLECLSGRVSRSDELEALAARCEREEPSRELDAAILLAIGYIKFEKQATWDAPIPLDQYALLCTGFHAHQYTINLHAAKKVIPMEGDRPWFWRVGSGSENPGWAHLNRIHSSHCDRGDEVTAYAKTAELALCAAGLKARAALAGNVQASDTRPKGTPNSKATP